MPKEDQSSGFPKLILIVAFSERKLLPKEKKSPTKKAQAGKIVKPKVTKPKETKPKETKTKETKPKEVKKPVVPNKKLKISDDEESETGDGLG